MARGKPAELYINLDDWIVHNFWFGSLLQCFQLPLKLSIIIHVRHRISTRYCIKFKIIGISFHRRAHSLRKFVHQHEVWIFKDRCTLLKFTFAYFFEFLFCAYNSSYQTMYGISSHFDYVIEVTFLLFVRLLKDTCFFYWIPKDSSKNLRLGPKVQRPKVQKYRNLNTLGFTISTTPAKCQEAAQRGLILCRL